MLVSDLRNQQHKTLLKARMLYRIVLSREFDSAYNAATNADRDLVNQLITKGNRKELQNWIKNQLLDDYGSYSLRQLRELGRKLNIPYSSRKNKAELLSEIEHERSHSTHQPTIPTTFANS